MTTTQSINILKKFDSYEKSKFNSNNAWGFGGEIGTFHTAEIDGVQFKIKHSKRCYRHTGVDRDFSSYFYIDSISVHYSEFEQKLLNYDTN